MKRYRDLLFRFARGEVDELASEVDATPPHVRHVTKSCTRVVSKQNRVLPIAFRRLYKSRNLLRREGRTFCCLFWQRLQCGTRVYCDVPLPEGGIKSRAYNFHGKVRGFVALTWRKLGVSVPQEYLSA